MINYYEILEEIPPDIRVPILKALENLRQEMLNAVTKSDFEALKNIVLDIALSQKELVEVIQDLNTRLNKLTDKVTILSECVGYCLPIRHHIKSNDTQKKRLLIFFSYEF